MRIIPAIDILNGRCVRLSKGDYSTSKIYNENPVEVARMFEDKGIKYLHLVDLDGAKSKRIVNWKVLHDIAKSTDLKIDFGGGIKSDNDIRIAFDNGARQVSGGSVAANNPSLFLKWLEKYGPGKLILGADSKNRLIMTKGWTEESEIDIIEYIKTYTAKGIISVICTDIEKDGMLAGPSYSLYKEIIQASNAELIASGGITSMDDLEKLRVMGCEGAIIGKAIYENKISLKELSALC